jgi:hypothetical protein
MMTLILYDDWLTKAQQEIEVNGKMRPRMSVAQIKSIMQLCASAEEAKFSTNGTLYLIK